MEARNNRKQGRLASAVRTDHGRNPSPLRGKGCAFRSEIIQGNGGRQIVVDDPSGNPVELFEPKRG